MTPLAEVSAGTLRDFAQLPVLGAASRNYRALYTTVLNRALAESTADIAWLAWNEGPPVIVEREPVVPLLPGTLTAFPAPPSAASHVFEASDQAEWRSWCGGYGILSCTVAPVTDGGQVLGSVGLASSTADSLSSADVLKLGSTAWLIAETRHFEDRLATIRRQFQEVDRALNLALPQKGTRSPARQSTLTRALGNSLDVTYCRIALWDAKGRIRQITSGGRRPPEDRIGPALSLAELTHCARALGARRPVVLDLATPDEANSSERKALFGLTTRQGVILPFMVGPRTVGALLLGEERSTRVHPFGSERMSLLEFVANRVGNALYADRFATNEAKSAIRRQRQAAVSAERARLSRELHDEVGQAISGLLIWLRVARQSGELAPEDLQTLEVAAQDALAAAHSVAYRLRVPAEARDPISDARHYSETVLSAAGCRLTWTDLRSGEAQSPRIALVLSRVIKESVTNVVRHARAQSVTVLLETVDGRSRVQVVDDGVGFVPAQVVLSRGGGGLGLLGNRERIAQVDGAFEVRSSPGHGAMVTAEVPRRARETVAQAG